MKKEHSLRVLFQKNDSSIITREQRDEKKEREDRYNKTRNKGKGKLKRKLKTEAFFAIVGGGGVGGQGVIRSFKQTIPCIKAGRAIHSNTKYCPISSRCNRLLKENNIYFKRKGEIIKANCASYLLPSYV
jgi:hypothetical protein